MSDASEHGRLFFLLSFVCLLLLFGLASIEIRFAVLGFMLIIVTVILVYYYRRFNRTS